MLIKLIPALLLLATVYWTMHHWRTLPPEKRKPFALKVVIYGAFIFCLVAVLTGRAHWLAAAVTGLFAIAKIGFGTILRALPFLNFLRRGRVFNNPQFKTAFLEVKLDLSSGTISGHIITGPMSGQTLNNLSPEDLEILEKHYKQHDKASYFLIRAIRQRNGHRYQQEQQSSEQTQHHNGSNPSVDEALQILGLSANPGKDDIVKAHRRLMQKLHPDRGGNDYLASRVNLAKETLLKHIEGNNK